MTDRFKEAENWLIDNGYQADGSRYGEDMCKILYEALTLATEAEHMKERLKLFEIKGEDDPSIVECCFSGDRKMTDKETIEHLYKWFKDFQNMLTYIEKQRNKYRDEAEQLRKRVAELEEFINKTHPYPKG